MQPNAADNLNSTGPAVARGELLRQGAGNCLRYLMLLLTLALLTVLFALAAVSPALAGMTAKLKASEEKGFARLVFDFQRLPDYSNEFTSGIFVLSFDEPVDVDVARVPEDIPGYVGKVRRDPDGRAVRFALKRTYQINIMEAGSKLFIDLLPPDWQGLPPSLPSSVIKELARKALEAEEKAAMESRQREEATTPYKLKIRIARHPTFSRIVFDWNKFVTATLARQGRTVTLQFGQTAEADFSRLKSDTPKFLQDVKTRKTGEGMEVALTVDEDVDVRGFREKLAYVIDLTGPESVSRAAESAIADALNAAGKEGTKRPLRDGRDEIALAAGTQSGEDSGTSGSSPRVTIETKDIDPAELAGEDFAITGDEPPDVDTKNAFPLGKTRKAAEEEQAHKTHQAEKTSDDGSQGKKAARQGDNQAPSADSDNGNGDGSGAEPGSAARLAEIQAEVSPDNLRFVFRFEERVPAAFFRRGNSVWMVFETDAPLHTADLRTALRDTVSDLQHIRTGDVQILRFKLDQPWLMHAEHANAGWIVNVGEMAAGKSEDLKLVRALREDKRSMIRVAMEEHGGVHWVTDPDIGDRLAVVPALPPQRGVGKPHEMVEFSALPTAHGLVIRPVADDVAVRPHLGEVLITRQEGLTLSAGKAYQYAPGKKPLSKSARTAYIDFKRWTETSPAQLSERIHDLQRAVALAPENEANEKRFKLARYYLVNGFHAEALGLLRRMAVLDPDVESDPAYNTMRGAALTLMGRSRQAREDFAVHALANDADASLWRGLVEAQEKNWNRALSEFHYGSDVIDSYRPDMQARFRLAAARAALELNKLDRAGRELNAVPEDELPSALEAGTALLNGRYLESVGRNEEARESYAKVVKSSVSETAAEARYRLTALDLKTGRISRKEALKALERLQLFWRGDDIELRTLRLLADLYVREERYSDAFAVMRNSVKTFPEAEIALRIQDDMKQVFQNLFLHGESEKLPPVKALSLFYGYRELTPVGRLGDEMIRRLAGRLISVDLLDQAAELLDHQVYKRLKGAARAQVATRLAMVHLMNHKPELALRAIRRTRQAGLPNDLQRSRKLLEARALGELGRAAAAVEILNTMEGQDVERLKADALWTAQKWQEAGEQIEKMLGGRWKEPEALGESERFNVLRAAIAYSLAGDQFALDRLHTKFYSKLMKTPDADSFLLVTKPIREKDVAFRNLAKEIAATDTLDAFMKEFRARYDSAAEPSRTTSRRKAGKQS